MMCMTFNDKLTELRKAKGWSQEQLGETVNVSRQTVSKWELGLTTPEMEKLIELSDIFGITIDELVGKTDPTKNVSENQCRENSHRAFRLSRFNYEYKSKTRIGSLPLVHINTSGKAKGIVAIGAVAKGIVSLGLVSLGLFGWGFISIGLLAIGGIALGGAALGGLAVGLLAIGGLALGFFALGGLAVGIYSVGGCAVAYKIALGGYASAHIAIGDITSGEFCFKTASDSMRLISADVSELRDTIMRELPDTLKFIRELFCTAVR